MMSPLYFALTPPDVDTSVSMLVQEWKAHLDDRKPGSSLPKLYALVDCAFVVSAYKLNTPLMGASEKVFRGTALAALDDISPCVIGLPEKTERLRQQVWQLFHHYRNYPMLSFLGSDLDAKDLARHLGHWAVACTDDGLEWPVRFADTRITPSLLGTLSGHQARRAQSGISRWWWPDRQGQLTSWNFGEALDNPANSMNPEEVFSLSESQFTRMVDAAAADGILAQLPQICPELLELHPPHETHVLASRALDIARTYGFNGSAVQLRLVSTALGLSHGFAEVAEFKAALDLARNEEDLLSRLDALPDQIWERNPSRGAM